MEWSVYEDLLGLHNAQEKDVIANDALQDFLDGIVNDPAYQEDAIINGCVMPLVADRKSAMKCSICVLPGADVHIGDMVQCFCEHWIIVELHTDKVGITRGEMWLCNALINFQNASSEIYSRHCVVDDGSYTKRLSNADVYSVTGDYNVFITMDNYTEHLYIDKRFSLRDIYTKEGKKVLEVYKISWIDKMSRNFGEGSHLMVMSAHRDVYNEGTDNL